jgi:hypothetical protein
LLMFSLWSPPTSPSRHDVKRSSRPDAFVTSSGDPHHKSMGGSKTPPQLSAAFSAIPAMRKSSERPSARMWAAECGQ